MVTIPAPTTLLELTWLLIGVAFGRGLGKQLDQEIQSTPWFHKLKPWQQSLVRRILDATHHFWVGLLLMCYAKLTPHPVEIYWFGAGLLLDDFPDIPRRYKRMLNFPGEKND